MPEHVERWPLRCGECGDRVFVGRPIEESDEPTGTVECRRGHILLFRFAGVTSSKETLPMMTRSPSVPGGTRYLQVSCRTCGTRTLVFGDRPRPAACARCKAPFVADVPLPTPSSGRPVPAR